MLRTLIDLRGVIVLACAAAVGVWGNARFPVPFGHPLVEMIELREPGIHAILTYGDRALWFTTPLLLLSLIASLATILVYRHVPAIRFHPLPPYAERFVRSIKEECLERIVPLGEWHFRRLVHDFVAHYHLERNHQGIGNELIDRPPPQPTAGHSTPSTSRRDSQLLLSRRIERHDRVWNTTAFTPTPRLHQ